MKTFLTVKLILACLPLALFIAVLFQKNLLAGKTFDFAAASHSAKSFLNTSETQNQAMVSKASFIAMRKF